jgi:hypothetical protein
MPGDPRKLPFFSLTRHFGKIATAIIVGIPLAWMMDTHLQYSSEEHNRQDNNPGGYLAYGLNKANNDIGKAATAVGETSDRITAAVEGKPAPQKEPAVPARLRPRTMHDFNVNLCLPRNLVEEQAWQNPAPGSKMESFRNMITDFILATGDRSIQYRIRKGAFEEFDPAWQNNPGSFIAQVDARQDCPPSNYTATLLVPAR